MLEQFKPLKSYLIRLFRKDGEPSPPPRTGQQEWMNFHQNWMKSSCLNPSPGVRARRKADKLVKRLAPELKIRDGCLLDISGVEYHERRVINRVWPPINECCHYTFNYGREYNIPETEKALTIYLWRKLYPIRYAKRDLQIMRGKWQI